MAYESCDWGFPIREQGSATPLPPLNAIKNISRGLALQARVQIAENDYSEALESLQMGFTLSQHLAEGTRLLVTDFVASNIATTMLEAIEDWVQRPDTPNLYWPLSALPEPYFQFSGSWSTEKWAFELDNPQSRQLQSGPLSSRQKEELSSQLQAVAENSEAVDHMKLHP